MRTNNLDNASAAAINFSNFYGFKPETDFINQIQQHPFYPSLWGISEVLEKEAGVKNFAVKIEPNQLKEVNFPCMAHLNTRGGE